MAKQTINLGTSANKGDGDPLRTAFDKVNDNFDEVYSLLGAEGGDTDDVVAPMLVHNDHTNVTVTRDDDANKIIFSVDQAVTDLQGSVFGDDSTVLVDGVNSSINLDGTVKGDIIPDTDVAYDLGSASNRFRDLYLSGSTIDLGGLEISNADGELQLGGVKIPTQTDLDNAISAPTGDLTGSVFADDSTLLVDGVNGKIVGPVDTASITQSDTGNFTSNFTTTITQDNQYTKFTKVDVFDDGEFVNTINREIKLGSNSLLFDSTVGASAVIRNDGVGGSLLLEAGTGNAGEGNADGGDIVITSGYSGVGGDGGNIILNSNADIFVGPLANTLDIRIGGGPGYAGENNTFFYGNVDIDSGKKLDTESVTNSSGNLTLSADNYVIIDSNNNGQINIGVESGIGNVLLGNIDNGTDVIVNGRLFHGGGIAPASSIGAEGDFNGEVVFDNSYIYYCTANYDGVTNIWKRVALSGDTW